MGSVKSTAASDSLPEAMGIPSLNINLPVIPANPIDGGWETTTKGISYLTSSTIPGETGNSIFYGHNWKNLLGDLLKSHVGQEITVTLSGGISKKFIIDTVKVVNPNQVEVLASGTDRRITVYTCTGFLDTKRFVVSGVLEKDRTASR